MKITEVVYYGFESELLEAHLAEHRPYVDRLIVAECDRTTTGYPKPLFFNDNKSRYAKYDVEHIIIPNTLYQPIVSSAAKAWGTQFRIQDGVKKQYVHPLASEGADWVFHNDTDEIVRSHKWAELRDSLTFHSDWMAAQMPTDMMFCFVNKWAHRDKRSYRWYRAGVGPHIKTVKGYPRGKIGIEGDEVAGWHLHNCYSTPEDLYWAAWNRLEWWDGPANVPDMDFWRYVHGMKGRLYTDKESSRRMESTQEYLVNDRPENNALCRFKSEDYLPPYVQANIDRFPVLNVK